MIGSKTYTETYIEKQKDPIPGKSLLEIDFKDPSFVKSVREVYSFIKDSVSEQVINAYIHQASNAGLDTDRSDILVFMALMAILLGDSRNVIVCWTDLIREEKLPLEDLKVLLKTINYEWDEDEIGNLSVNNMNSSQRDWVQLYREIIRNRGTIGAIKTIIRGWNYTQTSCNLGQVHLDEQGDGSSNPGVVAISAPYVYVQGVRNGDNFDPYSVTESEQNHAIRKMLDKLENVRPAGVPFSIAQAQWDLFGFLGGTYWRHIYEDKIEAWNSVKDTSIIKQNNKIIIVNQNGKDQQLSKDYDLIIMSRTQVDNNYRLTDVQNISFSEVANLSFESGVYYKSSISNADNSFTVDKEYKVMTGNSQLYNESIELLPIKSWSFDKVMRRSIYSLGRMEVS